MTKTVIELSEDAFAALFPLQPNHLNPGASWDHPDGGGCLFETYGNELAFVQQQDTRSIWTFIDDDDGGPCVVSGFHLVNRIGYLVSNVPVPARLSVHVRLDSGKHDDVLPPTRRRAMKAELLIAEYGSGNEVENLTDLLTDIRHWCDEHGEEFAKLDGNAERHYVAECINENEE